MKNNKILLGISLVVLVVIAWIVYEKFFRPQGMDRFSVLSGATSKTKFSDIVDYEQSGAQQNQKEFYCPQAKELIKKDTKWESEDTKWENYTPSSATKVIKFIGAQWVGVKVGSIICLYQTNEAVSFPLALEQKLSQLILEPKNLAGWSALVGNRRFCKSASVVDCPYYIRMQEDISNVYENIQYDPSVNVLEKNY